MAIGVAALSMLPYCQLKDGNVAVDLFVSKAPLWLQNFIDRCAQLSAAYGERFDAPAIVAEKLAAGETFA